MLQDEESELQFGRDARTSARQLNELNRNFKIDNLQFHVTSIGWITFCLQNDRWQTE